jgi:hypothetical protein
MIKKVVVIKNIPSNIIEEAVFTLKDNIKFEENTSLNYIKYDNVLSEAESLIEEYVNKYEEVYIRKENFIERILNILNKKV